MTDRVSDEELANLILEAPGYGEAFVSAFTELQARRAADAVAAEAAIEAVENTFLARAAKDLDLLRACRKAIRERLGARND